MTRVDEFSDRLRAARDDGSAARAEFLAAYRSYLRFLARDGIGDELRSKVDASDIAQDVLVAAQQDIAASEDDSEVISRNNVVDDDVVGREFYGKRPGHAPFPLDL